MFCEQFFSKLVAPRKLMASKILDNLYLGDVYDARNRPGCLDRFGVKNIVSALNGEGCEYYERQCLRADAIGPNKDIDYLHIDIDDNPLAFLHAHFDKAVDFIHRARIGRHEPVLVHCYVGMSRSTTIVVAYLMTITNLSWQTCLSAVKTQRPIVSPNPGFLRQLSEYQIKLKANYLLAPEFEQYRNYPERENDIETIKKLAGIRS